MCSFLHIFYQSFYRFSLFPDLCIPLKDTYIHTQEVIYVHADVTFQISLNILQIAEVDIRRIGYQVAQRLFGCSHQKRVTMLVDACHAYREGLARNHLILEAPHGGIKVAGVLYRHRLGGIDCLGYQSVIAQGCLSGHIRRSIEMIGYQLC